MELAHFGLDIFQGRLKMGFDEVKCVEGIQNRIAQLNNRQSQIISSNSCGCPDMRAMDWFECDSCQEIESIRTEIKKLEMVLLKRRTDPKTFIEEACDILENILLLGRGYNQQQDTLSTA